MEAVAFGDLHGDTKRFKTLINTKGDLYVSSGDLTNGSRDELIEMLRWVGNRTFFMVPGNNELPEWIPNYFNIHGEKKQYMGVMFGGIGGSPRTPFNTIFEWEEDYAYKLLEKLGAVDVFVSHAPPRRSTLSLTYSGIDAGSEAVRWYIEEYQPLVAIVGHIHERAGVTERIGQTVVVNPGKEGALIRISPGEEPQILWL